MGGHSKIITIQALRAVAALAVLIRHAGFYEYNFLAAGVDLFFVISGFIMVVSCWPEFGKQCAPRRFAVRRLVRIVPLYWLATLLMMVRGLLLTRMWSMNPELLEVIVFLSLCYRGAGAIGGVDAQL